MIKLYSISDGWLVHGSAEDYRDLALECESSGSDEMYNFALSLRDEIPAAIHIDELGDDENARCNLELMACVAHVQTDQRAGNTLGRPRWTSNPT